MISPGLLSNRLLEEYIMSQRFRLLVVQMICSCAYVISWKSFWLSKFILLFTRLLKSFFRFIISGWSYYGFHFLC